MSIPDLPKLPESLRRAFRLVGQNVGDGTSSETVAVASSRDLTAADDGQTLECTASDLTLTVPAGLPENFGCAVIPNGETSIASSGGALLNGATSTLTRDGAEIQIFGIVQLTTTDSYLVTESGAASVPSSRSISTTAPLSGGGDLSANRTLTTSMATNKLIGRGTAGTGVMEEITLGTNLTLTGTTLDAASGGGGASVANPGAQVLGLTAINGVAATAMRSDGAPALDVAIAPAWTGIHNFSATEPRIKITQSGATTDEKLWDFDVASKVFSLRTRTDADGAGKAVLTATRGTGTALTSLAFGNATDNPTYTFSGNGLVSCGKLQVNNSGTPANGIFLAATNELGLSSNTTERARFDANGNFSMKKGMADTSFDLQTPSTGFSITIANNIQTQLLNPAGVLATGTITMPATPVNGQVVRVSSSQTVTALTVSPNSGQTIIAAPTTLAAGIGFAYLYVLSSTTWYRLY